METLKFEINGADAEEVLEILLMKQEDDREVIRKAAKRIERRNELINKLRRPEPTAIPLSQQLFNHQNKPNHYDTQWTLGKKAAFTFPSEGNLVNGKTLRTILKEIYVYEPSLREKDAANMGYLAAYFRTDIKSKNPKYGRFKETDVGEWIYYPLKWENKKASDVNTGLNDIVVDDHNLQPENEHTPPV